MLLKCGKGGACAFACACAFDPSHARGCRARAVRRVRRVYSYYFNSSIGRATRGERAIRNQRAVPGSPAPPRFNHKDDFLLLSLTPEAVAAVEFRRWPRSTFSLSGPRPGVPPSPLERASCEAPGRRRLTSCDEPNHGVARRPGSHKGGGGDRVSCCLQGRVGTAPRKPPPRYSRGRRPPP